VSDRSAKPAPPPKSGRSRKGARAANGPPEAKEARPVPAVASALPVPAAERGLEGGDSLSRYMAELRHHAPISREEEHDLAVRWRDAGDRDAARRLVLSNLRLVVKIAMEYRRSWTNLLDLVQEGNLGLLQAVQRFDPEQGVKLSSYAAYWIRAYILKYLIDNIRMVRLGSSRAERKLFFRLNREKRELERQGFEPVPKLLAERLDVTEDDVEHMQRRLAEGELSLDAPLTSGEPDRSFGDLIAGSGESAEQQVGDEELRSVFLAKVHEFADGLDERERRIVDARILAEEPKTLQELGEEFGVTRERVRQLEARLVNRLREYLKANVVDFEYYAPED
jgi:RNA polymerase sigma-32 factor